MKTIKSKLYDPKVLEGSLGGLIASQIGAKHLGK